MGASFIFTTKHGLTLNLRSEAPKQYAYFYFSTGTPPSGKVHMVSAHTTSALASALAASVVGDTILFPDKGIYPLPANFVFPEGRTYLGQGIYNQNGGGSGTWLQGTGAIQWGANVTMGTSASTGFLIGNNVAGSATYFRPVARGASGSPAGSDTYTNGAHNVTFNFVRFKGGSDSGANLIELGGNYSGLWSSGVKKYDMVRHIFNDCEFERPQLTNAAYNTTSAFGRTLNIWFDSRAGGGQFHDNAWNRCHFGVANGYHTGIDGYGIGQTILIQPSPAEHASDGPRPDSGAKMINDDINGWNPSFDWSVVDHGASNISFIDCLFEYGFWCPIDLCDYSRSYSVWQGNHTGLPGTNTTQLTAAANQATGWGNPPQGNWGSIATKFWLDVVAMTRCYFKGSYPKTTYYPQAEFGRNAVYANCYAPGWYQSMNSGRFGDVLSGSFSNANRPVTALFPTGAGNDWTGTASSYTPSPYDEA